MEQQVIIVNEPGVKPKVAHLVGASKFVPVVQNYLHVSFYL